VTVTTRSFATKHSWLRRP